MKERELDIKDLLLYLWSRAVVVVIFGIGMATLGAGYGYLKQDKPETADEIYQKIITTNHDYTNSINDTKNSAWQVRPEKSYIVSGRIYIDFNFSNIEGNSNLDYSSMLAKLQGDATNIFINDDVALVITDDINKNTYEGVSSISSTDLQWQIYSWFSGANILSYRVIDVDADRALDIAKHLSENFVNSIGEYETIDSVSVIDEPFVMTENTKEQASEGNVELDIKKIIKFIFLGGCIGVILSCGLYVLIYILKDSVRTVEDLDYCGQRMLGRVYTKVKKNDGEYARIAYNIALLEGVNNILIVPVDEKSDADMLLNKIKEELIKLKKEINIVTSSNIKTSPDAILESKNHDAIVLLAKYGKTSMNDFEAAIRDLSSSSDKIVGTILDGVIC